MQHSRAPLRFTPAAEKHIFFDKLHERFVLNCSSVIMFALSLSCRERVESDQQIERFHSTAWGGWTSCRQPLRSTSMISCMCVCVRLHDAFNYTLDSKFYQITRWMRHRLSSPRLHRGNSSSGAVDIILPTGLICCLRLFYTICRKYELSHRANGICTTHMCVN